MNKLVKANPMWPLFAPTDFDKFVDAFFSAGTQRTEGFPKAEIRATEDQITIQLALAGYPKDALSIEVVDNTVTVKADKIEDSDSLFAKRAFTWTRRDAHNMWDFSSAEVKYEDGMLTIKAPKKEELKPKLLKIS